MPRALAVICMLLTDKGEVPGLLERTPEVVTALLGRSVAHLDTTDVSSAALATQARFFLGRGKV